MLPGSVNVYLVSYIPTISKLQGASPDEAALLVTIMGCVDLASRLGAGFITDAKVLSSTKLLGIAMLCIGKYLGIEVGIVIWDVRNKIFVGC